MNLFGWLKRSKTKREIIVNVEKLETRVAVMENGRLEEFMVEHCEEERLVGSIFKGRIQNLENDLQAAFVDIGLKKNAFLHYWDMTPDADSILDDDDDTSRNKNSKKANRLSDEEIAKRFPPGSEIIVQVTKGPISTKGPRVVANLSIPGRYLVMMPGAKDSRGATLRGVSKKIGDAKERQRLKKIIDKLPLPDNVGLVVRTVGQGASARAFARDLRNLLSVWNEMQANTKNLRTPCCIFHEPDLCERVVRDWLTEEIDAIVIDDAKSYEEMRELTSRISRRAKSKIRRYDGNANIFEHYGLERQLTDAFARKVMLKSGGYLVIDETEALIANKCVLISQHADSMGAPTACENAKVPNVSYNGSTAAACPETFLISSRINWAPYFEYMITQVKNGAAIDTDWAGDLENGSVALTEVNTQAAAEGTQAAIDDAIAQFKAGTLKVFDTSKFTVGGKTLTEYMADVDSDAAFTPDTNVVHDGYFDESADGKRSAPYFDIIIDGITIIG